MRLQCLQVRTCPSYITPNATEDYPTLALVRRYNGMWRFWWRRKLTVRQWQFECLPGCVQNRVVRFRVSFQIWKSRRGYPDLAPRLARLPFLTQFKILTLNTGSKILHQDPCHVQLTLLHFLLRERSKCTF